MLIDCLVGFCHEHALILYVYISNDEDGGDESVLTVSPRRLYTEPMPSEYHTDLEISTILVPTVLSCLLDMHSFST